MLSFFFQAEDGIRDLIVTGVQTCALPISPTEPACRRAAALQSKHRASRPLQHVARGRLDGGGLGEFLRALGAELGELAGARKQRALESADGGVVGLAGVLEAAADLVE